MTWDKGFNFRATSTYVTDGTNETYSIGESYPTTRNGVTFGYTSPTGSLQTRDRDSGVDRRLAGTHFDEANTQIFRVDVPASGQYNVRLAVGDPGNPQTVTDYVKDGTTALLSIGPSSIAYGTATDAAGVNYSDTAWPGSNSAVLVTMSGTALTLSAPAYGGMFQHLFLSQVAAPASPPAPLLSMQTAVMRASLY